MQTHAPIRIHEAGAYLILAANLALVGCGSDARRTGPPPGAQGSSRSPVVDAVPGAGANAHDRPLLDRGTDVARPPGRASFTGCLRRGNQDGTFVLRLAAGGETAPQPQSAEADTHWSGIRTFLVTPPDGADLDRQINLRVTVDGYVETRAVAGTAGSADTSQQAHGGLGVGGSASDPRRPGDAGDTPLQMLRAESVRTVADACLPAEGGPR